MIFQEEGAITITGDDGKEYFGSYHVDKGLLTVICEYGTEEAALPPSLNPEPLAKIMLAKIIRKKLKK